MDEGRHEGDGPFDGMGFDAENAEHTEHANRSESGRKLKRKHRRVTTQAVPGSDPTPQPEPPRHSESENDERLKADKPPHWG